MVGILDILQGLFGGGQQPQGMLPIVPGQQNGMSSQQGNPLMDLSQGLLAASAPSPYKKSFLRTLGEANASAYQQQMQRAQGNPNAPSAVQEYQFYQKLPDAEKENYLKVKRAQQALNLGGSYGMVNPVTGQVDNQFQKTLPPEQQPAVKQDQAAAAARGQAITTAQADLPRVIDNAQTSIDSINKALNSPGLDANFGMTGMVPNRPGSEASDAKALLDQIKGGAFLTAYGQLRGGGAITEIEGTKAEQAYARMQTAQSAAAFREAAKDYMDVINKGVLRAKNSASGAVYDAPAAPSAPSGAVSYQDYFK